MYKKYAAAAKSLQSCLTLCDPIDGGPLGSPVPGILQARTLEWVAIFFSNAWKGKVKVKSLSRVRLFVTPWSAAYQAPPSMGFPRQEYWSGVPLPSPTKSIRSMKMWTIIKKKKEPTKSGNMKSQDLEEKLGHNEWKYMEIIRKEKKKGNSRKQSTLSDMKTLLYGLSGRLETT